VSVSTDPRIGSELLGYRIEALLGRGGMGVVYRAYDPRLKRRVALKLLAPDLAQDERFRDRFLRESELAASLDHPSIVPIYEARQADGVLLIAMRYVEGSDLTRLLREQSTLDPARAIAICAQLADALDAAHEHGLVHRDVKPSNVLVDARGHCYLADFGLTRRIAERDDPSRGRTVGTADYVAPEQIRGEEVGPAADVYSLGCVLYECLTGGPPFQRESDFALLYAHLEEPPPPAVERRPELPAAIDPVLARALGKEPAARYETCGEVVEAARTALGIDAAARRMRPLLATITLALLVTAGLLSFFLTRGGGAAAATGGALVRIDPKTNTAKETIRVGQGASAVTASADGVWVAAYRGSTLWRVNPSTLTAVEVPANGSPQDVAIDGERVYIAANGPTEFAGNVTSYDITNGRRIDSLQLPSCVTSIAAGRVGIWATPCPEIARVSFDGKPKVLESFIPPWPRVRDAAHDRETLNDTAIGEGSVWVLGDALDRRLWRIDPRSGRIVGESRLPFPPIHLAVGAGAVWVTDQLDDHVARIDGASGRLVALIPVGRGASGVAVGAGSVWVTGSLDGTVSRVDPQKNRVVATIRVGGRPKDVAVGGGSVWTVGDAD
jgi:YVTN family beta-propeller protein